MKKRITFLLLTIMTLLSNLTFGQDIMTYTVTIGTTTDVLTTTSNDASIVGSLPITTRNNGDSIIYEFPTQITNLNFRLNIELIPGDSPNMTSDVIDYTTNVSTYSDYNSTLIGSSIVATHTLNFTTTPLMYKIAFVHSGEYKFVCYVRNYQVAKLPSNTVIPFVANFSSSITNYTATSLPTTITLPAPTSTVTWTQVLSYTTSNCVTYTEGVNTLQDCDTLTTLFISNNNSNVNYTITYNRPAQDITSIKEVKSVTSIVTYPNPCKDFIKVKFNTEQSILPIELYNLQGQLLLQNNEKRKLGDNEIEFNTQKLPNGVYFVKNGAQTVKFIKE